MNADTRLRLGPSSDLSGRLAATSVVGLVPESVTGTTGGET